MTALNRIALTLGLGFLYLPILVLIAYSFNDSRLVTVWGGFSTRWYRVLWEDGPLIASAWVSLRVALASAAVAVLLLALVVGPVVLVREAQDRHEERRGERAR